MGTLLSSYSFNRAAMSSWIGPSKGMAAFFSTCLELVYDDVGSLSAYAIAISNGSSGKGTSSCFFFFFFLAFFLEVITVNVSYYGSSAGV